MAGARDDMVIRPLLRRGRRQSVRDKVRERAQEERKTERSRKQKSRLLRRTRRALRGRVQAARARARAKPKAPGGFKPNAGTAIKGVGVVVTVIAVIAELIIQGGRAARRASGHSSRLVDATDAHTLYGGMDEAISADLAAVSFVEGNEDLLRIIGRQGRVNEQIADLMHEKRRLALIQAQGADKINRDPALDAPETLIDMLIAKANKAGLKGLADKAGSAVRSKTLKGPITTGR